MKRLFVFTIAFSLAISMVTPYGVAFGMEEVEITQENLLENDENIVEVLGETNLGERVDQTAVDKDVVSDSSPVLAETKSTIDSHNNQVQATDLNQPVVDSGATTGITENDPVVQPPTIITKSKLVISWIQTSGGPGKLSEEFVEIFNNSESDLDVTDWCLRYAAASEKSSFSKEIGCLRPTQGIGWRVILPAKKTVVFASKEFAAKARSGFVADYYFTGGLNNTEGRLALFDHQSQIHDAVSWGASFVDQGATSVQPHDQFIFKRIFDEQLAKYQDSDDSLSDFKVTSAKELFEIGNLEDVFDACLNLNDLQEMTPEGLHRDESTGTCNEIPVRKINTCQGVVISEIAANLDNQFIELHNTSDNELSLEGCHLQTNRSTIKTFVFGDLKLPPRAFHAVFVADTELTVTKTTTGTVYLLSGDQQLEVDSVTYDNLSEGTSWALVDQNWHQTYAPTPDLPNVYQKYLPCNEGYMRNLETGRCNKIAALLPELDCEEGKERNIATGRCRNVVSLGQLVACKEGQYRSEETNRCRSIASAASSVLKPCADDQFRSPLTNRCRKIASEDDLADCGEGRERNPDTNRCRNVLASTTSNTPFAPENVQQVGQSMLGWWAFGGVSLVALAYAGWQWRFELGQIIGRIRYALSLAGKP